MTEIIRAITDTDRSRLMELVNDERDDRFSQIVGGGEGGKRNREIFVEGEGGRRSRKIPIGGHGGIDRDDREWELS